MSGNKKLILIGWNPDVVDYSKYPGLNREKLLVALERDRDQLIALGYDAQLALIEKPETAPEQIIQLLSQARYDCVLIGAGVRKDDSCFELFETLVNVVHEHAPGAKICFNTGPTDSVDAVKRWI